jgi:hypothetical protein
MRLLTDNSAFSTRFTRRGSPGGSPLHNSFYLYKSSPSIKIAHGGRRFSGDGTAGGAGGLIDKSIEDGSPGGSPSQNRKTRRMCSSSKMITRRGSRFPGGRGAERASFVSKNSSKKAHREVRHPRTVRPDGSVLPTLRSRAADRDYRHSLERSESAVLSSKEKQRISILH